MAMMSPRSPEHNGEQKPSDATRVFGITELAEAILSQMDPGDLLISQRVCKLFREIVQHSTEFKQRLHLLPSSSNEIRFSPAISKFFRFTKENLFTSSEALDRCRDIPKHRLYQMEFTDIACISAHPEASWRKMQITSPPLRDVTKVSLEWYPYSKIYIDGVKERLSNTGGLTLGDLADSIHEGRNGYEKTCFRFEVDDCKHAEYVLVCGAERDSVARPGDEQS